MRLAHDLRCRLLLAFLVLFVARGCAVGSLLRKRAERAPRCGDPPGIEDVGLIILFFVLIGSAVILVEDLSRQDLARLVTFGTCRLPSAMTSLPVRGTTRFSASTPRLQAGPALRVDRRAFLGRRWQVEDLEKQARKFLWDRALPRLKDLAHEASSRTRLLLETKAISCSLLVARYELQLRQTLR